MSDGHQGDTVETLLTTAQAALRRHKAIVFLQGNEKQ